MPTYDSTWNTKLAILITSEQLEESISTNGLVLFFGIGRKRGEAVDEERIILLNRGTEEQVRYLASMIIQGFNKLFEKMIDNEDINFCVEKKGNAFYTIYGMVGGIISECAQLPIRFKDAFSKILTKTTDLMLDTLYFDILLDTEMKMVGVVSGLTNGG
ncbi:hypothetical protein V6N13_009627 [Hibiscus sabdariffa]